MRAKVLLSDENAVKVNDGVVLLAKLLRSYDLHFLAAQLQPNERATDLDGLSALETRVGVVERMLKLRPMPEPHKQRTIDFALKVLRKRMEDAKGV